MITNETNERHSYVMHVARAMMAAARTAPKAKGADNLEIITVSGGDITPLTDEMRAYSERSGHKFFIRDAGNAEVSEAVVLIGTRIKALGLNCGFCGFDTCAEKLQFPLVPCAFNTHDLGLAVGSAAAIAADNRIDSRVMYSIGRSAIDIGLLPGCIAACGILLSCTSKSPFFDRVFAK